MRNKIAIFLIIVVDLYLLLYMGQALEIKLQSLQLRTILMYVTTVFFIYYGLKEKSIRVNSALSISPFIGYLFLTIFMLVFHGYSTSNMLNELFFPVTFISIYYTLYNTNNRTLEQIIFIQMIFGVVLFVVYIYAFFFEGRVQGIYKSTCYFTCCVLPFVLASKNDLSKILGFVICALPTLLTSKRTSFISMGVAAFIYILIVFRHNPRKWHVILFVSFTIAFFLYLSEMVNTNLFSRIQAMDEDGGSGRLDIYSEVFYAINNSFFGDWLIGHGVYKVYATSDGLGAHNDFLEMFWNYGFVGFVVYVAIIIKLIKNCKVIKRHSTKLYAAYCASIAQFLVCSLFTDLIFVPSYIALFTMFWALCFVSASKK